MSAVRRKPRAGPRVCPCVLQCGPYSKWYAPRRRMKRHRGSPSSAMVEMDIPVSAMPESMAPRGRFHRAQTLRSVRLDGDEPSAVQPGITAFLEELPLRPFDVALEDVDAIDAELLQDLGHRHRFAIGATGCLLDRDGVEVHCGTDAEDTLTRPER